MLVAVLVLLGLGVSATGMSQLTEVRLTEAVNRNWRGAYDILVTPRAGTATAGAAKTSGLIEPDFLSYGGHGGIGFSQLDAIRRIAGVEIAAPVSTVGYLESGGWAPDVFIPPSSLPEKPSVYRLSLRVTTSDGVHRLIVSRQSATVALPKRGSRNALAWLTSTSGNGDPTHGLDVTMFELPPQVVPVVAVDPSAERRMFGPSFAFLNKLAIKQSQLTLGTFPVNRVPKRQFPDENVLIGQDQYTALKGTAADKNNSGGAYPSKPVVPMVVSEHLAYPLHMTLRVDRIGHPLHQGLPSDAQLRTETDAQLVALVRQEAGPGLTPLGTSFADLSSKLRALEPLPARVPWPGSSDVGNFSSQISVSGLDTRLALRASYSRAQVHGRGAPAFRIRPLGLVGWNGEPVSGGPILVGGSTDVAGTTRSYRRFSSVPFKIKPKARKQPPGVFVPPASGFELAPVDGFDLSKLSLPSNPLNHVPLGAWEATWAQLSARPGGRPGALVRPTSNPLGFLTDPPEAVINIDQASMLRGSDPIDAIRVRVGGLSGFDAASRAKVERVASQIAQLGSLNVRIVAGSSPRPVAVYVPRYLPGARDLGWVQEDWTSLGAAQAASSALSGAEKALLFLSLGLALLLAVTVSSVGLEGGARDVRVWRSLGWDRRRMLWWLVSDATLGSVLVAAAAVAATLAGGRLRLLWLGLGLGGSLLAIQLLFALLLLRRELGGRSRPGQRRRFVRRSGSTRTGVVSVARRAVLRQARISLLISVGIMLSAIVVVLGVAGLRSAGRSAHTSLLGAYLNTTLLAFHVVSLALLVIGGIAAAAIATRAWQRRRTGEIPAFAALGWQRTRVLAQLRLERFLLGVLAALLAVALAAALRASGVEVGGTLALPIILVLCGAYILAGEFPTRRLVQSRWPT